MPLESDFCHPPLRATARSLEAHFADQPSGALPPLRNPHHEPKVDAGERARARPAAVLIPIVAEGQDLEVILTRRHHSISFPGHISFPGGHCDPTDRSVEETALREAQEEISLDPRRVRVIGRLGDYVTHSGSRISPVVGLVAPPLDLVPRPGEVEEIIRVPLSHVLDSRAYRLDGLDGLDGLDRLEPAPIGKPPADRAPWAHRAYFYLEWAGAVVAGPTVSLLMGLYEELLKSHAPGSR